MLKRGQNRPKEIGGIRRDLEFVDDAFVSQQHYVGVGATDIKTNDHGNIPMVEGWCGRPDRAGAIPITVRRAETLTDMTGDVNHPLVGKGLRMDSMQGGGPSNGPRRIVQVFRSFGIRHTGMASILCRLVWLKRR